MPGLYPENPVQCDDCGTHFELSPGHASDGLACPECGGKRLYMNQPSPTQSDGTLRDMVDSASQQDSGGNPLGEGSIMGSPGNATATQPAYRRDEGTYGQAGNRQGSVTKRTEMRTLNMEPYMPWTHEASVHTAGPAIPLLAEGEAAALPAEVAGAGAAAGAVGDAAGAVGGEAGGLVSDAWGGLKGLFGAGAKKVPGQIAGTLMKGALRAGEGALGMGGGSQGGGMAPEPVTQAPNMMSYGGTTPRGEDSDVCPKCGRAVGDREICPGCDTVLEPVTSSYADIPRLLVADLQTPTSNPSLDEDEDDPEKQDQKEFNDGDHSPSNFHNPNNEDSGNNGEDGVKDATPGYGFGENSPGLERMMMVLPLLMHYFHSNESGEQDPIIKALHDTLEGESPGYLKSEDPEGPGLVDMIVQHHKQPRGVHAGIGPYPSGLPAVPMPGNGIQAPGGGTCPQCGGQLQGDGSCPQCGTGGQKATPDQTATPGNMMPAPPAPGGSLPPMMANHIGPVTPEQIEEVANLLISQGRSGEIEIMKQNPQLYAEELQQVQQNPNPAPPLVDPTQSQPPSPMDQAGGAMPVPDMGGAPSGQPMQAMSGFQAHIREAAQDMDPYGVPQWECPHCAYSHFNEGQDFQDGVPGDSTRFCGNCGKQDYASAHIPTPPSMPIGHDGVITPSDEETAQMMQDSLGPATGLQLSGPRHQGAKTADANNRVPRCPKCNNATTTLVAGADNDPIEALGKCHNPGCAHIWKLKEEYKKSRQVWAEVPNPVTLPAAEQHAPTNRENMQDPTMQWVDNEGNELQPNQVYELYSPAFSVPDMIQIVGVIKPDSIQVQLVGQFNNQGGGSQPFEITRHEAQLEHYTFVISQDNQDMDDRNTEPPSGTPGLEQVPPSGQTTDQVQDSYPNTALSHVEDDDDPPCLKCGSTTVDHNMASATRVSHECVRCAHYWETEDNFQGRQAGSDLSWVLGSNMPEDDFDFDRHQAMMEAGGRSRNIGDIAAKDDRLQRIKGVLDANDQARTAGRHFSPAEKRELIDEQGRARNLGDLDLSNTHYDTRIDYTGKANGENVDDSHFALGIPGL